MCISKEGLKNFQGEREGQDKAGGGCVSMYNKTVLSQFVAGDLKVFLRMLVGWWVKCILERLAEYRVLVHAMK